MDAHVHAVTPFSDVLDQLARHEGVFRAEPSAEWQQGRTLFGGLSAALAVASAERGFPDLPPLRSAQFAFVGPATNSLVLTPQVLRAGKSTVFVEVAARSEGQTVLKATLMFGRKRRSSHDYRSLPLPDVSPPNALPDFFDAPFAPRFAGQFDARFAAGARPVSGAEKPEALLWVRHKDPSAPDDVASIIALGDVPPPAAMTMFATHAPISTATWSIDVLADHFSGAAWHLMAVVADTIAHGYSSQHMTLWNSHGAPVLAARQTVAVFS